MSEFTAKLARRHGNGSPAKSPSPAATSAWWPGSCWPSTFRPEPTIPTSCRIAWWRSDNLLQADAGRDRRLAAGDRAGQALTLVPRRFDCEGVVLRRSAAERKSHDKDCGYSSSDGKISGPDIEGATCGAKPAIVLAGHFPLAPCRRGIESLRFDVRQDFAFWSRLERGPLQGLPLALCSEAQCQELACATRATFRSGFFLRSGR